MCLPKLSPGGAYEGITRGDREAELGRGEGRKHELEFATTEKRARYSGRPASSSGADGRASLFVDRHDYLNRNVCCLLRPSHCQAKAIRGQDQVCRERYAWSAAIGEESCRGIGAKAKKARTRTMW